MAIDQLGQNYQYWKNKRLVEVLFQQERPEQLDTDLYQNLYFKNKGLNQSQKDAIKLCLES
jgi:hypothetical protein